MACSWLSDTGTRPLSSQLYCNVALKKLALLVVIFRLISESYAISTKEERFYIRRITFFEHLLFDPHRQVDHGKIGKESFQSNDIVYHQLLAWLREG